MKLARKESLIILLFPLFLCGCLQSQEKLEIQTDGSGSLEVTLVVPKGTVEMIDTTMGGMMQGMSSMMEGMSKMIPGQEAIPPIPKSVAREMFANKDKILEQAKDAQMDASFDIFESEMKADGLHVHYKLRFKDIYKLMNSEILKAQFDFFQNEEGYWVLKLKHDEKKAQQTKMQIQQFGGGASEPAEGDAQMKVMMEAMKGFKIGFQVRMPLKLKEVTGIFKQKDDKTASVEFSGDMMDPAFFEEMKAAAEQGAKVVWSKDISASKDTSESAGEAKKSVLLTEKKVVPKKAIKLDLKANVGDKIIVYLKNGNKVEGRIVSRNDDSVKISTLGVEVTYYSDEIARVESEKVY